MSNDGTTQRRSCNNQHTNKELCNRHYENTPIQIYWNIFQQKKENFQIKNSDIFHIPAQNIDCEYLLEPPCYVLAK